MPILSRRKIFGQGNHAALYIGGGPLDAATTAWVAAVVGAGGTVSGTQQSRVDAVIVALKAASIFTKLDRLWLFAGESVAQQATIDIVALQSNTPVNSPVLSAAGYTGLTASSRYINTGFNPVTAVGNYALTSASMGIYIQARASQQTWSDMGLLGTFTDSRILPVHTSFGGQLLWSIQDTSVAFGAVQTDAKGNYVLSRTGASTMNVYLDGNSTPFGTSSHTNGTPLDSINFFILATNNAGSAADYSSDTISSAFIGGGLNSTEAVALMNALNTYMTAWSVNIY